MAQKKEDGEPIALDANKSYKVGVSAYKSTEITTGTDEDGGSVTNSAKYYGPEAVHPGVSAGV